MNRKNIERNGAKILTCMFSSLIILSCIATLVLLTINTNGEQRKILFSDTNDYFMDFFNTINHVVGKTPYTWGGVQDRVCAPLWYMLMYPFTFWYDYETNGPYLARTDQLAMFSYVIFGVISLYAFWAITSRTIEQKAFEKNILLISFLCSAPMIFNYDRANLTIIAAAALFFFLHYYKSENICLRHGAYLALAVAAALKLFPAICGVLLLYEKRWKDSIIAVVYGLAVFFIPFLFLKGGFDNISLWIHCVEEHEKAYLFRGSYGLFTHTIINMDTAVLIQKFCGYILLIVSLVIGIFVKENWKKILLLVCAMLLTSGQQEYYCGIYLIFPIIIFFNQSEIKKEHVVFTILFIIIMSPFRYTFSLPTHPLLAESISTSDVQNMCLVIIYLYLIFSEISQAIRNLFNVKEESKRA